MPIAYRLTENQHKSTHDSLLTIILPDESNLLNVILHEIYALSSVPFSPPFETLETAVHRLVHYYGVKPPVRLGPNMPLHSHLLSHAPLHPLEVYALASSFELEALAVASSSHLLSLRLLDMSDAIADRIGPVYLKRLYNLHLSRTNTLKEILLQAPLQLHGETKSCNFSDQQSLGRAWTLATAFLLVDATPS